jgi:8-oxo-dGTP pyrophosphatase MutT (NUDIX family)
MARRFPVAVHIFFLQRGKVLLLRRLNTGYEDGNYSVPAGHLEGDETVVQAAVREVREEVGLDLRPDDVAVVGTMHRKSGDERVDFFVTVRRWSGEPSNCEPTKCDDLSWFPLDALPSNTIPYIRRAVENSTNGVVWFEEFGW